jgi:hypothetical protein
VNDFKTGTQLGLVKKVRLSVKLRRSLNFFEIVGEVSKNRMSLNKEVENVEEKKEMSKEISGLEFSSEIESIKDQNLQYYTEDEMEEKEEL